MRGRLPAVVLLLLAVFTLTDIQHDAHRPAVQMHAVGSVGSGDSAVHQVDEVLPRLHPSSGAPTLAGGQAVLPPAWAPDGTPRPITIATTPAPAAPRPDHGAAGARAPPSTTR
ncbi:hypothetical protein [Acrocarpospora catenulata]|uniref:hypothetical protein n=1 Tax=Acrocarpospora catenulata TaxID=2836182 RepID=UPI001BDB607B|nr:hypothetical protein [Acrocarpospora catenulata]